MSHPDLLEGERPRTVGVLPPAAFHARTRLWRALEQAFPVRFVARECDQLAGLDAAIAYGVELATGSVPLILQAGAGQRAPAGARIDLAQTEELDPRLRGWALGDERSGSGPALRPGPGEIVLASRDGAPAWVLERAGGALRHRCLALPQELDEHEALRDRFRAGRFFALLPVLALLRALTRASRWTPPPARAAFVFDDPNLHWTSYGYLDFAELAARARRGRFHVAFATVPLDAWYANRRAVELFRAAELSLLVHGNDHAWCELGRATSERSALSLVAQALARVQSFEQRSGLTVARVMAPPHGQCSPAIFQALRRARFLAACISRPYPWLQRAPAERPLAQWGIADVVLGLPVLPRYPLGKSREDIPLRSFLGQPLILYGHHADLAGGPGVLEEIATEINRAGDVQWGDLASIARSSFLTRRDGELLKVRMYTQEASVELPAGVARIAVELPAGSDNPAGASTLVSSGSRSLTGELAEPLEMDLDGEERKVTVRLVCSDAVRPGAVRVPRRLPWPRVRRLLTEGRDRLAPSVETVRRRPGGG